MRNQGLALLSLTLCSCATHLEIVTDPPGAEVALISAGSGEEKTFASTPFQGSLDEHRIEDSETTPMIRVRKAGYDDFVFAAPDLESTDLSINLKLNRSVLNDYKEVNKVIRLTFEAQNLISKQDFNEALEIAEQLESIHPNLRSIYHIRGTVFLLQDQLAKSRRQWEKALEIDSTDIDADSMLKRIVKAQKSSAQGGPP